MSNVILPNEAVRAYTLAGSDVLDCSEAAVDAEPIVDSIYEVGCNISAQFDDPQEARKVMIRTMRNWAAALNAGATLMELGL